MIKYEIIDWGKHYLPIDLRGKIILNEDAGEGETSMFFLKHGASKVVCIESCTDANKLLVINAYNHPDQITPINTSSNLTSSRFHMTFQNGHRGVQKSFAWVKLETAAAIKVHGLKLCDKFEAVGWRVKVSNEECIKRHGCSKYSYWCG
jgi:hypothetical protein